ncbi:MAG: hypothetical protein J5662_06975 [Clostridia bacterium]|nr:hypothetical protein [Clostridia bacterium]
MKKSILKVLSTVLSLVLVAGLLLPMSAAVTAAGTYDSVPAMVQSEGMREIYNGIRYSGTLGAGALDENYLPGYGGSDNITISDPAFNTYDYFELDFYVDNVANFRSRVSDFKFIVRRDNEKIKYDFRDQITEDGWNHVIIPITGNTWVLESGYICFWITMNASDTGATDRYRLGNICATMDPYNIVPAMSDIENKYVFNEGAAYYGTFGSSSITGNGHLPNCNATPAQKNFTNPGLYTLGYSFFEFDFYLDNYANFVTRNAKMYLNLRYSGSASRGVYEFTNQVVRDGWNHIRMPMTNNSTLDTITIVRFYIDIDAGSTGENDRYKIANVYATVDPYDDVPATTTVTPRFDIYEGAAFGGTFGSGGLSGQQHLPNCSASPAQTTFSAGSTAEYSVFEFDFYIDDISIITARNTKLYLNLRSGSGNGTSRGTYEFQDQLTADGWNHIKVITDLADDKLEILTMARFYIDIDAGGAYDDSRYRVANIFATVDEYYEVPETVHSGGMIELYEGMRYNGTLGGGALDENYLPGYTSSDNIDVSHPAFDNYDNFELDFYIDDAANFSSRVSNLYFVVRRDNKAVKYDFSDQITVSGWNHVKIPITWTTGTDKWVLESGYVRFYITKNESSVGATDRYRLGNVCATLNSGNNLLGGLTPVSAYAVNNGTADFSYHEFRLNGKSNLVWYGYNTRPEECPSQFTSLFSLFTDGLYESGSVTIGNHKGDEDVLLAYKLGGLSQVNSIFLNSGVQTHGLKVYLSNSFTTLFRSENLAGSYTENSSDTTITIEFDEPKTALYVGFVFETSEDVHTIKELAARGIEYPAKEYSSVLGSKAPINSAANKEVKDFYNYLCNLGDGSGTLLGAEINVDKDYGNLLERKADKNYFEYLEKLCGGCPAIVSSQWNPDKFNAEDYKYYFDEGAIPMISVGVDSPTADAQESQTGIIKYLDSTYSPSYSETSLYNTIQAETLASYAETAAFLHEIEDAGVKTYIIRPFIERKHKGRYGNTHYGNNTRQNFINVWQQMITYLKNDGLTGFLVAFAPVANYDTDYYWTPMQYYPGDNYVDIIAPTVYSQTNDGNLPLIDDYAAMIATGKPFAMSEIGIIKNYDQTAIADCLTLLESIKTVYPEATFINLWYGTNFSIGHHSHYQEFIDDDYIITAQEMEQHQYGEIGARAELFASKDFGGNCTAAPQGNYSLSSAQSFKSLSVNAGYKVSLYSGADYTGNRRFFAVNIADLNAKGISSTSSVKVEVAEAYTPFDTNNDSSINVKDLVRVKRYLLNSSLTINELAADSDISGHINDLDLTALRETLLN